MLPRTGTISFWGQNQNLKNWQHIDCFLALCLIFTLPSKIWAFIWVLPLIFLLGFIRLPSASINFCLCCYEKNLFLSWSTLLFMFNRSHIFIFIGGRMHKQREIKRGIKFNVSCLIILHKKLGHVSKVGGCQTQMFIISYWI